MQVLILGAGASPTGADSAVSWLAEHGGRILVERLVEHCAQLQARLVFAVKTRDLKRFHIDEIVKLADPSAEVVAVSGETAGAACTALLCIHHIAPDDELLILNSNEFLDVNYRRPIDEFRARELDAGVITFKSLHPRYSYVAVDAAGLVVQAAEKRPISQHATAGFYWFKRGADFIAAAQAMIRKDAHVDEKFFICPTLNEIVLTGRRIGAFEIDPRHYHPLKSQRQIDSYENAEDSR